MTLAAHTYLAENRRHRRETFLRGVGRTLQIIGEFVALGGAFYLLCLALN